MRRRAPHSSASRRILPVQGVAILLFSVCAVGALLTAPGAALPGFSVLLGLAFLALIGFRCWAACLGPAPVSATGAAEDVLPLYSVMVPLYREAHMLPGLVRALEALDYPAGRLDVILVVEEDDPDTLQAAIACAPAGFRVLACPAGGPRTKPKALTWALAFARGDLLTIYDAEDRPAPDQLRAAAAAFAQGPDLVCVQAPLSFYNSRENWLTRCFQLEYAIHFRVMLPALIRLGAPIPLGGTSNHFRTARLRAAGGWDPFNVTEDADLGFRIAGPGGCVGMIAPPTLEEATCTLPAWIRQRSRWLKGYAQTVLVHTRPGTGMGPRKAAALWLTLGGALASAMFHAPALVWLVWAAARGGQQAGPGLALLAAGYASAAAVALAAARRARDRGLLLALLATPLYWPLQSVAAVLALRQLVTAPFRWEKTEHGVSRLAGPAPDGRADSGLATAAE